jgi:hypothetical protein
MVYGTGGLAFGSKYPLDQHHHRSRGREVAKRRWLDRWRRVRVGLRRQLSAKIEALYFNLEPDRFDTPRFLPLIAGVDSNHTGVIIRAGINYRFNWGGPVVASH